MKAFMKVAACAALIYCAPAVASAATITKTLAFTATDFGLANDPTILDDRTVSGSFTVTFDTETVQIESLSGITLNNLSIAVGSPLSFTYTPTYGSILIGGSYGSNATVYSSTNDFRLRLRYINGDAPEFVSFVFSQAGADSILVAKTGTAAVSAVPEPATWAMMIVGFGMAGGMLRASRRKASVAAA